MRKIITKFFFGQIKDLNSLQRYISRVLSALGIGSLVFAILIFGCIFYLYKSKEKTVSTELISNANSLLQSNLSEQLSIIANNQDFINYLRSGVVSRQENYSTMAILFSNLDQQLISGVEVDDINGNQIFATGNSSNDNVTLKLCYMTNRLNSTYGICNYQMTVYLNQVAYISRLNRINSSIQPCRNNKCKIFYPFSSDKMGSFPVLSNSSSPFSINYIEPHPYELIVLLMVFISLILVLWLVSRTMVKDLVNSYLAKPIHDIQSSIKNGKRPTIIENVAITELSYLAKTFNNYQERQLHIELGQLIAQAAHDIRSPLISLQTLIQKEAHKFGEQDRTFIRNAFSRLDAITSDLVSKYKGKEEGHKDSYVFISACVLEILSEKRLECEKREHEIEFEFYVPNPMDNFALAYTNQVEFKRMLSNLLNNSINALQSREGKEDARQGKIELTFETNILGGSITIQDNGAGMKPERISDLLSDSPSDEAKIGLGLYHAKNYLKSIGGNLDIESEESKGTTVYISLPSCKSPDWLISSCSIKDELLVVIDDDQTIHDVWAKKIEEIGGVDLIHFFSPEEFLNKVDSLTADKKIIIFSDYEFLNSKSNGVELLKQVKVDCLKVLVTSHFDEEEIVKDCDKNKFKLLSKNLVPSFKLDRKNATNDPAGVRLIFIDDDRNNTNDWEFFAEQGSVSIVTFNSLKAFIKDVDKFDRKIPVYIDYDLGNDQKNGIEAAKEIFEFGFNDIYLATGYIKTDVTKFPWIKRVVDKEPPFIKKAS